MIFTSHIDAGGLTITAHPENEAEWSGFRFDGDCPALRLVHTEVKFEYPVKAIHPDLLGMLCMLLFFPFCKNKITFPQPVSVSFQEAFSDSVLPPHEKIDGVFKPSGSFDIQNVDKTLARFSGSKLALSFGGGIDSMAAHILFPEAILIHELSRNLNNEIIPDNTVRYLMEVNEKGGKAISVVSNGRRWITHPTGWTTWISSAACAVLLATDLDIGYLMRGTTSDSLFLGLGYGFKEVTSVENIDPWFHAFNLIGLHHFTCVGSITEAATMKICYEAGLLDKSVSCQSDQGGECHACFKCLRKDTLANALQFRSYPDHYWKRYKTEKILRNLNNQPLLMGHIFRYSLPKLPQVKWLRGIVDHFPDSSSFLLRYYEPGIGIAPAVWQEEVRNRLNLYLEPLKDEEPLEQWKQPDLHANREKKSFMGRVKAMKKRFLK